MLRGRRGGGDTPQPGNAPGTPAGAPGGEHRYQMREKLASFGDDFWIENGVGQRAFKVDGKALRLRDNLKIRDATGREVAEIQEKVVRIKDTMDIERGGRSPRSRRRSSPRCEGASR